MPFKQFKKNIMTIMLLIVHARIYTVSQNVPPLACYNFDTCEGILIFLAEMLSIK